MTWVVISHLFTYISMLMTDIFLSTLAEAIDHFQSLSLKPENSRISLQGSLVREPSLRMLSLSEIFTIKPHVLLKKNN